jgi:hypothetical protein
MQLGLEDYRILLDAARQDWENGRDEYFKIAREAAAGAIFDDEHIALLQAKMDRSLNEFITIARQLQDEVLIKRP